jgi:hypothetical protein
MALEGSLRDFGLADILQLIFFQRKTGILTIEGRMDKIRLLFFEGRITGAESKRRIEANRLGKVLVKSGLLEEVTLQALLDEQKGSHTKLGNILVKKQLVNREDVQEILTTQIKETVIQLFNWKDGSYAFSPQAVPVDKDIPILIDTQHLLMEGLRIVDEWTLIEGKITLDTIFIPSPDFQGELDDEEKDIVSLVDGENDVSTIIDISGKDDFTVSKSLLSLLEKGAVVLKEAQPVVIEAPPVETVQKGIPYRSLPALALIVACIVSLLPVFSNNYDLLKRYKAGKTVTQLRFAVDAHKIKNGSYPSSLDGIATQPDPWGNQYIYVQQNDTFMILSAGADRIEGTSDDIY